MPKRGGKSRNDWKQGVHYSGGSGSYSDEHDDRDRKPTQRRVSFKPSGFRHGGNLKGRMAEMAIKTHYEDDDIMGEYSGSNHHSGGRGFRTDKGRRKGSPIPRGKFGIGSVRKLLPSTFGWYQVTIPYGHKYQKDEIIRYLLNAISPDIFIPHYWREEKTCVIFFVDDLKIAERLQNCDRTIQMSNGFNLGVKVRSGIPIVNCDDNFRERMKLVMAKRYNAQTKALDLSKFHADPDFKDIFCGLFRPVVMAAVIDIIEKNIPDLVAINLNNNQIQQLETFKNISQKLPELKILYLAENRIHAVANLSVFRGTPIVELVLTNNPLRNRYKDQTLYVSEVRRKFPKLLKLDGQNLEPLISFDVLDSAIMPKAVPSYFCNLNGAEIVREFLKQYILIYDSDSRQPLLEAYHEQAMISLTCSVVGQQSGSSNSFRLAKYWPNNRNLLRASKQENDSFRLLKIGRLPVVSFLSELPKTQHDLMSFSVDLSLFLPSLISFTVAGLFKESNNDSGNSSRSPEIRSFQRHIVLVPGPTGGFLIRNEMILITYATPVQVRTAFKQPLEIEPSLQNRLQQNNQTVVTTPVSPVAVSSLDDGTKLQMIQAMSAQSNMNMEWSKKCLEDTNWDFANAAFIFNKLHKENKIPPEAFTKNF